MSRAFVHTDRFWSDTYNIARAVRRRSWWTIQRANGLHLQHLQHLITGVMSASCTFFFQGWWFHSINNPHRLTRCNLTACWQIILRSSLLSCRIWSSGLKASLWFFSTWKQNKHEEKLQVYKVINWFEAEHSAGVRTQQVPGLRPLMGGRRSGSSSSSEQLKLLELMIVETAAWHLLTCTGQ